MALSDAFYQDLIVTVDEVLDEFGTTYTVYTPGTYNEDTLVTPDGTTRVVDGLVADSKTALSLTNPGGPATGDPVAATWIGEKNLLLKASANPQTGEEILIDGKRYPLKNLEPIKPADIVVLYIMDLSR